MFPFPNVQSPFRILLYQFLTRLRSSIRPFEKMSYAQFFLKKLQKMGRETKKLKLDPGSVSGACLRPLIDKKVFQQLVINLK